MILKYNTNQSYCLINPAQLSALKITCLVTNPQGKLTVASATVTPLSSSSRISNHNAHTHTVSTLHIDQYSASRKYKYKSVMA